jgi:hypothetical protein
VDPQTELPAATGTWSTLGASRQTRQPTTLAVLRVLTCYTILRAARKDASRGAVTNQNITLSLPREDLREARILAARRGTSVSQLLARLLRETVERETGYDTAKERSLALLRQGMDLGTSGRVAWSRDNLYER